MPKQVRLRELAAADLADASEYYRQQGGDEVTLKFIDAVQRATRRVGRGPRVGSLHFAYELQIPDLRAWALGSFPHVVFYVDTPDAIDVWRVPHTRRDIGAAFESPGASPKAHGPHGDP